MHTEKIEEKTMSADSTDDKNCRWLFKAFRAFIIACRWVLHLPILRQIVNFVGFDIFMTTVLIGWSLLFHVIMQHFKPEDWVAQIVGFTYLAMPEIAIVVHFFHPCAVSFLYSTFVMSSLACLSTFLPDSALYQDLKQPYGLVAFSLSIAFYGQCNMQDMQMSTPIASVSFFPLVVSVWTTIFEPAIRMALLIPMLVYCIYLATVILIRKIPRNTGKTKNRWIMISASLLMSIITITLGAEVAVESAENFLYLICGMVLVFIGGCAYNITIVALKLKVLNRETFNFEWLNEKEKIGVSNGFILVLILMCGDIFAICMSSDEEYQFIFFSIFISLYVVQPFVFLPAKGYRFKCIHCTLMLVSFTASLVFVIFAEKPIRISLSQYQFPYLPALCATNSSSWFPFGSVPNDYQVDGGWLGAVMCALLFVHFTMTALVQADLTAVDKMKEGEIKEWMLEELEIIPAKPVIEKDKF